MKKLFVIDDVIENSYLQISPHTALLEKMILKEIVYNLLGKKELYKTETVERDGILESFEKIVRYLNSEKMQDYLPYLEEYNFKGKMEFNRISFKVDSLKRRIALLTNYMSLSLLQASEKGYNLSKFSSYLLNLELDMEIEVVYGIDTLCSLTDSIYPQERVYINLVLDGNILYQTTIVKVIETDERYFIEELKDEEGEHREVRVFLPKEVMKIFELIFNSEVFLANLK